MFCGFGCGDVVVVDDGDCFDGIDDGVDVGEVNVIGEVLCVGVVVYEDG